MKIIRGESGQSMLPILATAGVILTGVMIASTNLTNGTKASKTAQLSAESDILSTAVYQVINSPQSCSKMIQYGDGIGTSNPKVFFPVSPQGVPPVAPIQTGLTLDGTQPFLAHGSYVNSLVIPSPSPGIANLRFDPKGFVNYGQQPAPANGQSVFANTKCYLANLHVEAQNPKQSYGSTIQLYDFPIYIGVDATDAIVACQGASGGSPCVAAFPAVLPSPNFQCGTNGGQAPINYTLVNATYGILSGPSMSPTQVPSTGPYNVTLPSSGSGPFTYTLMPYSSAGTPGAPATFNIDLTHSATLSSCSISVSSVISWAGDQYTSYVDVMPAPGPSQAPTSPPAGMTVPAAPGTVFTCTPYNQCGTAGHPLTTTFGSASPSPTVSPPASPSPSPSPSNCSSPSTFTCPGGVTLAINQTTCSFPQCPGVSTGTQCGSQYSCNVTNSGCINSCQPSTDNCASMCSNGSSAGAQLTVCTGQPSGIVTVTSLYCN